MKWLLALAPLVAALPAVQQEEKRDIVPAPGQVTINGVTYGGTGCPQGSVSASISEDKSTVTIIYDSYVASIGPDVPITETRKACQLNLDIQYPGGFQYSVLSADYRGYVSVDKGVTGYLRSGYYFSGQMPQSGNTISWTGPRTEDYTVHDEINNTSVVWSPCGKQAALNVKSQVSLQSKNKQAQGLITSDSTDLGFKTIVYVQWAQC